ncbi:DUF4893 domain-containing protein [Sphingomonas sp. dw_22]|uniref:DUF4893 domain-containing protein n=1 Tax=Sphingomonas sp. dw_22 TaxID=2721175 RepID=UPI001BD42911|nr:DUF4893 domain-containing protein [Sphingomonas sp. dw_22]
MYRLVCALFIVPALAACAGKTPHADLGMNAAPSTHVVEPAWRKAIAPQDSDRLAILPAEWAKLHGKLRPATRTAQGPLLDPTAGLANAELPPGSYRCRTLHLRAAARGPASVRATPQGFCYVSGEADSLAFSKQTGTDIAAGYFYPDGKRYIFLGARQRRAGENSYPYGADPDRDVVGVAERVGNFRWRLAVTGQRAGDVDVYELTPVPAEQQPRG